MHFRLTLDQGLPVADLKRIDDACDQFEAGWRNRERPIIESFLLDFAGPARAQLLRDLLALELDLRLELGEKPDRDEYRERFPGHDDVIDAVFGSRGKTDHPPTGPDPRVTTDPTVDGTGKLGPTIDAPKTARSVPDRSSGRRVSRRAAWRAGPGRLRDPGGAGPGRNGHRLQGAAVALNRLVALKVIRSAEFASEAELIRFQNEAEAVAHLDHPHIVPIYEVGHSSGQRFFSMKLVDGTQPGSKAGRVRRRFPGRGTAGRHDRRGHRPRPPARDPPPRLEAGQHPGRRPGRTPRHRLRPGAANRHRERPDALGIPAGHAVLHVAGAGQGRQGLAHDGDRRLRPGLDPLRAPDRPRSVRGQQPGRDARQGPRRGPRAPHPAQRPGAPRPGDHLPEMPGEGPATAVRQRPAPGRRPEPLAGRQADRGPAGGDRDPGLDVVPAQPLARRAGGPLRPGDRRRPGGRHLEMARGRRGPRPGRDHQRLPAQQAVRPGLTPVQSPRGQPHRRRTARPRLVSPQGRVRGSA